MKDQLKTIEESINNGCGKQSAIKAILEVSKLVGTATKTPRTFNMRLVDKDITTHDTHPFNSILPNIRKEYIVHLCRMGHLKVSFHKHGGVNEIDTI